MSGKKTYNHFAAREEYTADRPRWLLFAGIVCFVLIFSGAYFLALIGFVVILFKIINSSNEYEGCITMDGRQYGENSSVRSSIRKDSSLYEPALAAVALNDIHDDMFSESSSGFSSTDYHNPCGDINPATGFPMAGCIDVAGNPYGMSNDSSFDPISSDIHDDSFPHSSVDDTFSSCGIDDPFSSACDHIDSTSSSSCFDSFDSGIGGCGSSPFDD